MTTKRSLRGYSVRADKSGPITFLAASDQVARDGLIIEKTAWDRDLQAFKNNPVVLWHHDYKGDRPPIGRAVNLRTTDKGLVTDIEFDQGDPFAVDVERKIRANFINAVSVGWDTVAMEPGRSGQPARVTRAALLDISIVNVPGDAYALSLARSAYRSISYRSTPTKSEEDAITRLHAAVCGTPTMSQQLRNASQRLTTIEQRVSPENIKRMVETELRKAYR